MTNMIHFPLFGYQRHRKPVMTLGVAHPKLEMAFRESKLIPEIFFYGLIYYCIYKHLTNDSITFVALHHKEPVTATGEMVSLNVSWAPCASSLIGISSWSTTV